MEKRTLISLWGGKLFVLTLLSMMLSIISLAQPLYMLSLYDRVLSSQSIETLVSITLITLFVLVSFGGFDRARHFVQEAMGRTIESEVRPKLLEVAVRLSAVNQDGVIRQRLAKLDELKGFITSSAFVAIFDLVFTPIYFLALYLFHPTLFALALGLALFTVLLAVTLEWSLKRPMAEYHKNKFRLKGEENELLRNAADVVALGRVPGKVNRYLQQQQEVEEEMAHTQHALSRVQTINKVLMMMIQTVVLGTAAYLVVKQEVPVSVLFAANIVATRAMQPLFQITSSFRSLARASEGWNQISASLAKYRKDERAEQVITTPELRVRTLTVVDQEEDRKPINNVTFDVDPGEIVVVTGESGAGKSTLLRAVVGLTSDYVGQIELDGREIKFWRFNQQVSYIGYLPQDIHLFTSSIVENITGESSEKVDMEQLVALCREVGIHDKITALKDGYETQVRGAAPQFSGGQVRLLGLARALWGDPQLLVLDEPTTGLDRGTEQKIIKLLRQRQQAGVALLVTSHSTLFSRVATKILWLKWGRTKAYGLRDEMLEKMGMKVAK